MEDDQKRLIYMMNELRNGTDAARPVGRESPAYRAPVAFMPQHPDRRTLALLAASLAAVFIWSGIGPRDRFVWFLEVAPVLVALAILIPTYRRFRFTTLVYVLIWLHSIILMVGGHYTYAEVPLFNWIRDAFELSRNHYDRVGHFAQGFIPAMVAREVLLRASPLQPGKWLFTVVVSICLAASAFYELIEWWVAEATGEAANAFLGTQGDVWDTQKDMTMCLIGAVVALLLLARWHDRQLARGTPPTTFLES